MKMRKKNKKRLSPLFSILTNSHLPDLSIGSMKYRLSQKIKSENGSEILLYR